MSQGKYNLVKYNFDQIIDRADTYSTKWQKFPADVLPMWVADMDFAAPDFVIQALRERLDHSIIGYTDRPKSLNIAFQQWLQHHFGWSVPDEWIVWLPGVVPALNLAARTLEANASFTYYETLDDFQSASGKMAGAHARVHGYVANESIRRDVEAKEVWFKVQNDPPHAGGPPVQMYLLPQKLEPRLYVGTCVIFFTVVNWLSAMITSSMPISMAFASSANRQAFAAV